VRGDFPLGACCEKSLTFATDDYFLPGSGCVNLARDVPLENGSELKWSS
jgi:hypothetical protein